MNMTQETYIYMKIMQVMHAHVTCTISHVNKIQLKVILVQIPIPFIFIILKCHSNKNVHDLLSFSQSDKKSDLHFYRINN